MSVDGARRSACATKKLIATHVRNEDITACCNSCNAASHHQAVRVPGDKLIVSAVSPQDGVIEAVELDAADHFVLAVQWHPERTYSVSAVSRAIFAGFVRAADLWQAPRIEESVSL